MVIFLGIRAALSLLRVSVVSKYNIRDRQQSTGDVVVGRLSWWKERCVCGDKWDYGEDGDGGEDSGDGGNDDDDGEDGADSGEDGGDGEEEKKPLGGEPAPCWISTPDPDKMRIVLSTISDGDDL